MTRKIIPIESAKIDNEKPLLTMTKRELDQTFAFLSGDFYEEMMDGAREGREQDIILTTVLLEGSPGFEPGEAKILFAYEDYGDGANDAMCEDLAKDYATFLLPGEKLRLAKFVVVDLSLGFPFDFPSEKSLSMEKNKGRQRLAALHDARGLVTILVVWLKSGGEWNIVMWRLDHGDGDGMNHVRSVPREIKMNRLLAKGEKLKIAAYVLPRQALQELEKGS